LQNTSFRSIEVLDVVRGNNESVSSADGETLDTEKLMRRASGRKLFSPSYMRDAPAPPTVKGLSNCFHCFCCTLVSASYLGKIFLICNVVCFV
jgi:hypothetical protein